MTNTPIQVTTDYRQFLAQINQKLDKIDERLNKLEVGQARIEEKVGSIENEIKDIKGSQRAQIWALIGILGTAVVGTIIRLIIQNPPKA